MFQKIIGIVGALAIIGTIVMVAITPRKEGFVPGLFDFVNKPSSPEIVLPESARYVDSPLPAEVIIESVPDSTATE